MLEVRILELTEELKHANEFIDLAFEVYPNLDVDIEIYQKYKDVP